MSRKTVLFAIVTMMLAGAGFFAFVGRPAAAPARIELTVQKLTCGACARKIEAAVGQLPGTGEVAVDVAAGRVAVAFDPQRVAPAAIAEKITAAGYPAALQGPPAETAADRDEQLKAGYVGRIGERLVSRDEFTAEVDALRTAAGGPRFTEAQLRQAAWRQIVERNQPQGGAPLPVQVFDPFLRTPRPGGGSGCSCCG